MDLNDSAACAGNVGMDGFLDGAIGIVEHDGSVSLVESALGEGPASVLEHNGGGRGGVINHGDLLDVVGVDQIFYYISSTENRGFELVVVKFVGLLEPSELPLSLGGGDGCRARPEAAVVEPGDGGVVVGELGPEVRVGDGSGGWGFVAVG